MSTDRGRDRGTPIVRGLGAPALFAVAMSSVGASVYFALGVVAGDALGLTPAVFAVAALFLLLAIMTYVEGSSVHPERGGASSLARYAFDELWSFVAGWAILLDYLIVMAVAAEVTAAYLTPFWPGVNDGAVGGAVAVAVIGLVVVANVRGISADRLGAVLRLVLVNLVLLSVIVVAGLAVASEADVPWGAFAGGRMPTWEGLALGLVVATVAVTGIEAASGLAGEVRAGPGELRRVVGVAGLGAVLVLTGVSLVAVAIAPGGAAALGGPFVEAPVLSVVSGVEPRWLADMLRVAVGLVGAAVLVQAVNSNMLGLSRLSYSLAVNRQVPPALGRLHATRSTPVVAIAIAGAAASALAVAADIAFMLDLFAFGAMLAFAIAHVSVIVLRYREPDRPRPYRMPLSVTVGGGSLPIPALVGAIASVAAFGSVLWLNESARWAGLAWMTAGLTLYVLYRRSQGHTLRGRFTVPVEALREAPEVEYGSILVPVFGRALDDDIVGTAGRLASDEQEADEGGPMIEALYVVEVPMSLPLDARVPEEQLERANRALARAKEVGEEYEGVEVATARVRGRSTGEAIVTEARRRGVEAIVLAAEEPSRIRGGTRLGGRSASSDRVIGEVTRYVVEKAPCRVILTAPAGEEPAVSAPGGRR